MKQSISRFDLNHINRPLLNNSVYLDQSTAISVHLKSHGGAVRTSNTMQRTVCGARIVEGKPPAHVAGRHTFPCLIVLMPEYWSTMPRRIARREPKQQRSFPVSANSLGISDMRSRSVL